MSLVSVWVLGVGVLTLTKPAAFGTCGRAGVPVNPCAVKPKTFRVDSVLAKGDPLRPPGCGRRPSYTTRCCGGFVVLMGRVFALEEQNMSSDRSWGLIEGKRMTEDKLRPLQKERSGLQ